ncbi:MAG: hypothetical protein M3Y06_02150, partial [Actinomycetota bacterium]|nr:hypothetical protein [Actinomycetota bacterium]
PFWVPVLSTLFALTATLGGILLALGSRIPISPYVTTLSFVIYLLCRLAGRVRSRRGWSSRAHQAELTIQPSTPPDVTADPLPSRHTRPADDAA